MKLILAAFLAVTVPAGAVYADDFCNGFEAGYATGYKQASGSSLDPLTPLCPLQPLQGLNDPESDWEHGYIIGYEHGLQKGRK